MLLHYNFSFSQDWKEQYSTVLERKDGNGNIWYHTYKDKNQGLCDKSGKEILSCAFSSVLDPIWRNNKVYIQVSKGKGKSKVQGLYDGNGNEILPCKFKSVIIYPGSILLENFEGKYGVADYSGQIVLDCISSDVIVFNNKKIDSYTVGGKEGVIATEPLRILTPAVYKCVNLIYDKEKQSYSDNYVKVNLGGVMDNYDCLGGKWGIVDSDGREIIKPQYIEIRSANNNLFTFNEGGKNIKSDNSTTTEGGKWGVVDNKGNIVIPCQYDEPIYFKSDVAMVKKDGEVKLVKNPLVRDAAVSIAENTVVSYKKDLSGPAVSRYPAPDSEVDKDIPQANKENENTFAFIVANENYPDAPVPYALNDGRMFATYCEKTLGIPKKNINQYEDATYGSIISMVDKMKSIAKAYEGDATFVVYYAGHGFPDEKQSTAYLLPVDGSGSEITTTGYSLSHLYDELSKMPLKDAVVFLDACFSGAKREDDMLAQSRGVAIKVKSEQPKGNLLVFSASQGDETAHQMEEKHHGLFTYFLLKGLQQLKGSTNLGDLTDYVTKNVKRQSVVINNKKQTPTVIPSLTISSTWRGIQLSK